MNKIPTIKDRIKADLPKCFNVSVSKNELTVWVSVQGKDIAWDEAHKIMRKVAKKNKLEEVHSGTFVQSGDMDWEFVNKVVEKRMTEDADTLLKCCKTFFKNWGNAYANSDKAYDKVEKIRAMFETDEN